MRSLEKPYRSFLSNLERIRIRGIEVESESTRVKPWRLRFLTEGLISDLWQGWNNFTRTVLLMSCKGCSARDATLIARRPRDNSWQRIGYEANQAAFQRLIRPGKVIKFRRQEPTWGDMNKVLNIISGLNPSNKSKLMASFGLSLRGPKHMQLVRNACAHKNKETMAAVRSISIYYISKLPQQPSELVWQVDRSNKTVALYSWISDLKVIADLATLS